MAVRMGYKGACRVGSVNLLMTSFSAVSDFKPLIYNHTVGLLDDTSDIQDGIYRSSPYSARASISAHLPPSKASTLFSYAKQGTSISIYGSLSCAGWGVKVEECIISSLTFSVVSGGFVDVSIEALGKSIAKTSHYYSFDCETIVNWLDCSYGGISEVQSFSLNINNPCTPMHTSGSNLKPEDILVGIQKVTGSVSFYGMASNIDNYKTTESSQVSIKIDNIIISPYIMYQEPNFKLDVNPVINTLNFTCVNSDGSIW